MLPIPRVKPLGWIDDELLTAAQITQMDLNISLLDGQLSTDELATSHATLQSWRYTDLVPLTADVNHVISICGMLPVIGYTDLNDDRPRSIAATATVSAGSPANAASFARSYEGSQWEEVFQYQISPAIALPIGIAAGAAGQLVIIKATGPAYNYSSDQGSTWAQTSSGSANNLRAFYAAGHWYMAKSSGSVGVGTSISTFTTGSVALPGAASALAGPVSFATDGATVVVCGKGAASADSTVWVSTDNGVTWTTSISLYRDANVAYSKYFGKFVIVDTGGSIFTSVSGAPTTWVTTGTNASPANDFDFGSQDALACAGPAIVHSVTTPTAWISGSGDPGSGIAYSLDLGATWNYSIFGLAEKIRVVEINRRIYAYDTRHIWASGPLAPPKREV